MTDNRLSTGMAGFVDKKLDPGTTGMRSWRGAHLKQRGAGSQAIERFATSKAMLSTGPKTTGFTSSR
jgi:hypothetical protein